MFDILSGGFNNNNDGYAWDIHGRFFWGCTDVDNSGQMNCLGLSFL